ncbi:hypothetical protein CYMTET_48988 [Cymbomonas tetramitiformis]|uniref:Reverse transcriptase domain-containing protein n=1 Tax=Cymbomonas tetramitiformis TaxID=36881 RepID=A0AAE0EV70_9CHLO|nr:hypothetical protein CYMTET_48988 [Cymbomonas tetramitiformis]
MDLLQNLTEAKYTPLLEELCHRMLRGHNTKKGVYGLLCNRYTMIGYRSMLEGDNEAHGGADAVRAKLAFMEQKIYARTEGMVADTVLTKWLAEFHNSKAKSVMTATAKQAAGAASRAQRSDHRVGGGRGGDRAPPPNSPGQTAYDTGVCTLSQRSMARWRREQRSTALDRSRSEDAVGERPSTQVRPRDLAARSDAGAAGLVGHRDGPSSPVWSMGTGTPKTSRFAGVSGAQARLSWRRVMDFRWLNEFYVKSKCKMETLKKLRRPASQGDWCFTFDLKDGYHAVGIDPDFQEFMHFDI